MSIAVLCQRAQNLALHPDALQIQQLDRELRQAKATKRQQPLIEGAFKNLASARQKLASLEGRVEKGAPDSSKSSSISICERIKNLFSTAINYLFGLIRGVFCCGKKSAPTERMLKQGELQPLGLYRGTLEVDPNKKTRIVGTVIQAGYELWDLVRNGQDLSVEGYAAQWIDQIVREGAKKIKDPNSGEKEITKVFPRLEIPKQGEIVIGKDLENISDELRKLVERTKRTKSQMICAAVFGGQERFSALIMIDARNKNETRCYLFNTFGKPVSLEVFDGTISLCNRMGQNLKEDERYNVNLFTLRDPT